jgi:flagellar hook-associated protein 3 FlgL
VATRIGDLAQNQRMTVSLLTIQARLRAAQVASSSGKVANRFAEIADAAGELVRVKDTRALKATLAEQSERLSQRLQVMDGALGSVTDIADRARVALVQRLDGGLGNDVPLDATVDTMLAELEATLNTQLDGHYLFAGTRADAPAVALPATPITTPDPTLYYRGDDVRLTARADTDLEVGYGVTAGEGPFANLIAALGHARAAHLADARAGLRSAMSNLTTALDGLTDLRARLGTASARLESVAESHRSTVLYLDEITSGIEDADLATLMTQIAVDQTSLEAGYTIAGRLSRLTLADYLR